LERELSQGPYGRVEEWIAYAQPDVLCLQETKLSDATFPALAFQALGYETAHHGSGQWNGVAICSRVGLRDVTSGFVVGIDPDADTRLISAICGGISVTSVYVPMGGALRTTTTSTSCHGSAACASICRDQRPRS